MKNLAVSLLKGFGLSALCLSALFFLLGQSDAPQDPLLLQQMNLSSQVRSALLESRQSMERSTEYFTNMISSLKERNLAQSEELTTLWKLWTDTTNSYNSASEALGKSNTELEMERQRRQFWFRLCLIGSILCVLNWIGKGIMFILWIKKVPVPRWLDILV